MPKFVTSALRNAKDKIDNPGKSERKEDTDDAK